MQHAFYMYIAPHSKHSEIKWTDYNWKTTQRWASLLHSIFLYMCYGISYGLAR